MSQKERNFQSKARHGAQKFGNRSQNRDGGKDKPYGRPSSRDFSKGNEIDRGARPFDRDSRPKRNNFGDKPYKNKERGDFNGKPDRDFKPAGNKKFGGKFGDKPYRNKERGDFNGKPDRGFKPAGNKKFGGKFGDKKPFNKDKRFAKDNRPAKDNRFEHRAEQPLQDTARKLKSDRPSYGAPSSAYLFGVHAVTQALLNPKRVHQRLLCTPRGFESLREAWQDAQTNGIDLPEVVTVEKEDLERLLPRDAVHQDVLLDCQPLEETFLADVILTAPDNAVVMILDQVTDPHNVGAILRSASAFGAIGVIMQKIHAPETTGTLAKSASGAVEHVPLIREVNLSRTLEQLKEAGFFCIGLAEEGRETLAQMNLSGKTALVLGAEGPGLRRLVAQNCDALAHLPTQAPIGSLNVSNAAAVALYELVRAR